ncbi:MAG: Asp-tRNA(Asn)/Glu-tRNA(Gln) amidotransferase subunit GatB [Rickettsiales bacterium]|jgi:aspartyl-tRNA(Asn)/glutamyl-tRNA(Gln) amidotransferase subunit B|nr:Asp-tRNA(Asn)/Glu-tRNA(Gln) amidotransferase subunit GatB [Rickettsiales bacterium]
MYIIHGKTGKWELVIGLETHIEVKTNAKLFSGASADYKPTTPQNTQVSFIDAGFPGMLPVLNRECVNQAIRFGLAINADISKVSRFARKQYFYPDLPMGYQISQPADEPPVVGRGYIEIIGDDGNPKKILIERAHLETDAGKLIHDMNPNKSFADYNRAGVALLEIVTYLDTKNPENNEYISSPDEAEKYLRQIREIARATGVSNANMEQGSMRADVNVSVRRVGEKTFRTRTETKNMVSFRFIKTAIEYEARRHIEIYESGGEVSQDTMHYNQEDGTTSVARSKEDALDYRYFPDPDLLPIIITDEQIETIRKTMPEMPAVKRARFINEYGLSEYDATRITENVDITSWFEIAVDGNSARAKPIANWMITELFAHPEYEMTPENLRELVDMILDKSINGKQAKEIFIKMLDGVAGSPKQIADKFNIKQTTDLSSIEKIVDDVLSESAPQVEQYKSGKVGLLGFFVGVVMKKSGGSANPTIVSDLIKQKLA